MDQPLGAVPELAALASRFDSVPMTIGEWTGTSFEMGAHVRKMAGAEAYLSRVYTNAARGVSVSVLLIGGLPGDIATHTPDACYPGAGYELSTPEPFKYRSSPPDGPRAGFLTACAERGGADPSVLRIFWTWHSAGGWAAPEDARWRFASEPTLCKLYVIRETGGAAVGPDHDPCNDFLDVFLPALERTAFAAPG